MAMQSEPPQVVTYGLPTRSLTPDVERWFIFHGGLTKWDFNRNPVRGRELVNGKGRRSSGDALVD